MTVTDAPKSVAARIPLARPYVTEATIARVRETLESGWITEGPVTRAFEAAFARFIGTRGSIAVTSCTTGLDVALRALGIGPGDEVIVPDYTYPCTASVPALLGATAVIVDIDRETLLVDCDRLEAAITPSTRAIVPVSIFGNPLDEDRLDAIRRRHGLPIVEDAACSVGSVYKGAKVGRFADITVFSLHPRKILTIGEGGLITTEDPALEAWMRSYKNFGLTFSGDDYSFDLLGHNCKVSDILSSVGLVMMDHLPELLEQRRAVAGEYRAALERHPGVVLPRVTEGGEHCWQSFPVLVEERDRVLAGMRARGIEVQIGTHALHRYPAFQDQPRVRLEGPLENSRWAFEHCMVLPMHHQLDDASVARVIDGLRALV